VRFRFGSFLCHFPWARLLFIGTGLDGGQKGCLQRAATARTADRKRTVHTLAMISIGRMRVMNKQKKKVKWLNYSGGTEVHTSAYDTARAIPCQPQAGDF